MSLQSRYALLVLDDSAANVAALVGPADVVVCQSADEACARLQSGRRFSAVMACHDHAGTTHQLMEAASRTATPVLVVGTSTGAARLVEQVTAPTMSADRPPDLGLPVSYGPGWRARVVAVCGPGGTGTSTVAAALAAALAADQAGRLLLADLALRADQVLVHGVVHPTTGLLDLIGSCRYRAVDPAGVWGHTVDVGPGYRLLPGLRRPAHWTAVGPRAFDVALGALCSAFELVVAELTGELDGEEQVGSIDVEERNHMARRVAGLADVVVVIGGPGRTGGRWLRALIHDLVNLGVEPDRIQPVVNRSRHPAPVAHDLPARPLIALPHCVIDESRPPPATLAGGLPAAVRRLLAQLPPPGRHIAPVLVTPGSLGSGTG